MIAPIDKAPWRKQLSTGERGCEASAVGLWHMAKMSASGVGMTSAWLEQMGLLSLKSLWAKLAPHH